MRFRHRMPPAMKAAVTAYYVVVVLGLGTLFLLTRDGGTGPLAEPTPTGAATVTTTATGPASPSPTLPSPTPPSPASPSPSPTLDVSAACRNVALAWIDLTERW